MIIDHLLGFFKSALLNKVKRTFDPQNSKYSCSIFQSGLDISISHGDKFAVGSSLISIGSGVILSVTVLFSTEVPPSVDVCSVVFSLSSSFVSEINK